MSDVHDMRRRWIEALLDESNQRRQTRGAYQLGTQVCAIGLAATTLDLKISSGGLRQLDLPAGLFDDIVFWNDQAGLPFHEIGTRLKEILL